jgi:hypothetical protein
VLISTVKLDRRLRPFLAVPVDPSALLVMPACKSQSTASRARGLDLTVERL